MSIETRQAVLSRVNHSGVHIKDITKGCSFPDSEVHNDLVMLELENRIKQIPGKRYRLHHSVEVLVRTRAIIEDPEDWLQEDVVRDDDGNLRDWWYDNASRFGLFPALMLAVDQYCEQFHIFELADQARIECDALWQLYQAFDTGLDEGRDFHIQITRKIAQFNAYNEHSTIIEMLTKAIRLNALV